MYWKIYKMIRNFARQVSTENVSAYAASTAFFTFLSLIPLLMVVCAIIPYTPITESMLMGVIARLTPHSTNGLMVTLIEEVYDESSGILPVAAIGALWIAAKGMLALMRGLNAVGGVTMRKNYFLLRLEASLYTVLMLAAIMGTLMVLVFGNVIAKMVVRAVPQVELLFRIVMRFRFLVIWVLLAFVFALIYTYVPDKRLTFHRQIPGAVFAAVSWSVFSWGFSVYIDYFGGFSMYGKLTTVIIIMLWLYFCMYIMLIGAKINHLWE
ncbi:MAG: YihY/virulence factor BrkB family protein [Lachnospiraceae bacterium]|nr:YihY/virulence factor BrkB family protein [Lachnospiraceae bacterium]